MPALVLDLMYGLASGLAGALITWWICRGRSASAGGEDRQQSQRSAMVLARLHDLATRVAVDIDDHKTQVEEIHSKLAGNDQQQPTVVVDVVAQLIKANQQMQERLTSTEGKLREQAQQIETHAIEARTDALTMLANRRALDDELARRQAEYRRQGRTFSMIIADVDHFKNFNDRYGHQAGDDVLRDVAKVLRRKMREMDLVARYGGEEFAIVLPGTNREEACRAALRACEAIAKSPFRHDGKELAVTVSFGAAQVAEGEDAAGLVQRADKALYASKAGGRNCVHWHDGRVAQRFSPLPPVAAASAAAIAPGVKPTPVDAEGKAAIGWPPRPADFTLPSEIPNRTAFCQQVRSRLAEWKRGGPTFSLLLVEVNHYEGQGPSPNPAWRQRATQLATRFLTASIRDMDVVGQYAPGSFAILLPTAELADAIRVAERHREDFARETAEAGDGLGGLTLSVGVVQVLEKDDSISVLQRAETALDAADRRGGNRTYCHDGQRCAPVTAMLETMDYLS